MHVKCLAYSLEKYKNLNVSSYSVPKVQFHTSCPPPQPGVENMMKIKTVMGSYYQPSCNLFLRPKYGYLPLEGKTNKTQPDKPINYKHT